MTNPDKFDEERPTESFVVEPDVPETAPLVDTTASEEQDMDMPEPETTSGIIAIPSAKREKSGADAASTQAANQEPVLSVAYRCLVGAVRRRNEDSCLVVSSGAGGHFGLLPFGLYIVADGMGGHANGHVASRMASRVAAKHVIDQIYLPLLYDEGHSNQTPIQEVMLRAVQNANTAVYTADPESDSGTTLTAALILGRRLHIAHVGDSRLYLLLDGKLEQVTNDHSLVQRMQDVGQPADDETFAQIRHVLLRAVGQIEDVEIDTYMRLLPKTGKLLLCSDGLCGFVSDDQMQKIMVQDKFPAQIADELTDAAMAAGGFDNITAIVVDFAF